VKYLRVFAWELFEAGYRNIRLPVFDQAC